MPTPFYTRGDKQIVGNAIEELELERDKLDAAFTAVNAAVGGLTPAQVEHTVDFDDHAAPLPPQSRVYGAVGTMLATGGFVTAAGAVAPVATFDVTVGGVSILAAPIPGAAMAPGIPVPLVFVAVPTAPPGAPIAYVWTDGGAPSAQVSANVRWQV